MKDKVKILLRLDVLFTQDSKVEDLFFGAPSSSEPSLVFKNYPLGLGFEPVKDDFLHDFVEWQMRLIVLWFWQSCRLPFVCPVTNCGGYCYTPEILNVCLS